MLTGAAGAGHARDNGVCAIPSRGQGPFLPRETSCLIGCNRDMAATRQQTKERPATLGRCGPDY